MPKPCSMTGAISGCDGVMDCSGFIAGMRALSWDTSCPNASGSFARSLVYTCASSAPRETAT
jgi:hypothetical protein